MNKKWSGVIILGLLCLAIVFFNKSFVQPAGSVLNSVSLSKESSTINDGKIIFAKKVNQATLIQSIDNQGKVEVLFTDQDESEKITEIGDLTKNMEIPVKIGKSTLLKIKIDGEPLKTILSKDFSGSNFVLSPNGKEIAFISFSNAEKNYGYSVSISNLGGNLSEIYRSENEISRLNWSGDKIAFIENDASVSNIKSVSTATKEVLTNYTTNSNIIDFNFKDNLVIDGDSEKKLSKLGTVQSGKAAYYYQDGKHLIGSPVKSFSGDKTAFLVLGDNLNQNSTIYTIDNNGKNLKKIEQGIKILGWIN